MTSIHEILDRKRPATRTARILIDPDLRLEHDRLERRIDEEERIDITENRREVAPGLRRDLEALEDRIREAEIEFVFRALPRVEWLELLDACPPTAEDKADGLSFDAEKIAPELISRAAVSPEIDLESAKRILSEWADAEAKLLFATAYAVQSELRDVPFIRRGSEIEDRSTATRSNTSPREGSPTPSS